MSSITIDVPHGTEKKYGVFMNTLVQNYSVDELEDTLLGLHIEANKQSDNFVSEKEIMACL